MKIPGVLEQYGTPNEFCKNARLVLITGKNDLNKFVVLVGGLTEGLMPCGFENRLLTLLEGTEWSLAPAQLLTCYNQFGVGSLDGDADDILLLAQYLKREHNCSEWILAGHSTGCNDAVRYVARNGAHAEGTAPLKGVILLSPVSDRQNPMMDLEGAEMQRLLATARDLKAEGKADEIAGRFLGVPMSAFRLLSLMAPGGDDDMFSSDLSDGVLKDLLGHMSEVPLLATLGTKDETLPESLDKHEQLKRLGAAFGNDTTCALVEGGTHEYEGALDAIAAVIAAFVKAGCDLKAHPLDVKGVEVVCSD